MQAARGRARCAAGLALALLAACAPEAGRLPIRLMPDGAPLTLGRETRLASAAEAVRLVQRGYESLDELPGAVALPDDLARGERVLLSYRLWSRTGGRPASTASRSTAVPVSHQGARAFARLAGLPAFVGEPPFTLRITALPLARGPERLRFPVAIPEAAVLAFGYALREESLGAGGSAVRFRVFVDDGAAGARTLFQETLDPSDPEDARWFDASVDLTKLAGREAVLVFESEPLEPGAPSLGVWSDPSVYPRRTRARPNVMVISLDTLRARSLGTYGYPRDTSPFIDALAAEGTLFEEAITTSVTTGPSHMSLFTGLYPVRHGLTGGRTRKTTDLPTLPQRFRSAGYDTAAFTEDGFVVRERGFGDGFAAYVENRGAQSRAPGEARRTFGQAASWLAREHHAPFFLFVHTYQVHFPYQPPKPYAALFSDDGAAGPQHPGMRRARDDYDREIRYLDDRLRELFAAVRERGLADSTLVVVLADHGEEFAEHGRHQHGGAVFDETLRVPMIFWGPGRIPPGRRHGGAVSLIDVAPTLLELAGLPVPETLDGTSLAGAILDDRPVEARTLFAEARSERRVEAPSLRVDHWNPPLVAVRSSRGKFIVHRPASGEPQPPLHFDLLRDPQERSPLPIDPEEERAVTALVDEYLGGRLAGEDAGVEELSPDLVERLRQLGYLD